MKENPIRSIAGIPYLLFVLAVAVLAAWLLFSGLAHEPGVVLGRVLSGLALGLIAFITLLGLYTVQPNQAAVISLFGKYVGTVKDNGLRWNNPFFSKKKISLRVRNFESGKLKVNELDGSPIEIAAVIV